MRLPFTRSPSRRRASLAVLLSVVAALPLLALACAVQQHGSGELHRWWAGFGPVLPHDTFPADCRLCHVGEKWNTLAPTFKFDHQRETGVPLNGAHAEARCLRCHNDRGPVSVFRVRGCIGCHEDFHSGDLGARCDDCHTERSWRPVKQFELHYRTRFPLTGAHSATACHRCHPGAQVGNFVPTDTECVTCHRKDLVGTNNPPHIPLGWVDHCDRCHMPTRWKEASIR